MALDLAMLTSTPDIRGVAPIHARLVCALRYTHMARHRRCYSPRNLAAHLGTYDAVRPFHIFLDEAGQAWPDPIALNPACQQRMSYDEMLLVDCATAAAKDDRATFDAFLHEMIGAGGRRAIWHAARRMMKAMGVTLV